MHGEPWRTGGMDGQSVGLSISGSGVLQPDGDKKGSKRLKVVGRKTCTIHVWLPMAFNVEHDLQVTFSFGFLTVFR